MIQILAVAALAVSPACVPTAPTAIRSSNVGPVSAASATGTTRALGARVTETPKELYEAGVPFGAFLENAEARKQMWHDNWGAAVVPEALLSRARDLTGPLYILAIAVDSCSDSVNSIPVVAKLVEQVPGLDMRIIDSKRGRSVMESHRTKDGRPATPTLLLLNRDFEEVGCWVERPAKLQSWYDAKQKEGLPVRQLTEQKMGWYRDDAGKEILSEVVQLMEAAASGGRICSSDAGHRQ
jgi:Thioredoxin